MKRINLNVDFTFSNPSTCLPLKIKNSLTKLAGRKINKTINFFKPKNFRHSKSIHENENLASEAKLLSTWLEEGFPSMFVEGYSAEIGTQVMSGLLWILPGMDLHEPVVLVTARTIALGGIYDDILDTDGKYIKEEFRPIKENLLKSVLALLRLGKPKLSNICFVNDFV